MSTTTRRAFLGAAVSGAAIAAAPRAMAAYYNEYDAIAGTPSAYDCTGAQGFAAGSTYLYSIKNRSSDDGRQLIYRVNRSTGARVIMTNGDNGLKYTSALGHANDMAIADIDGRHHLFVVTMKGTGAQLVRLRYDGTTYYRTGSYTIKRDGVVAAMSGISKVATTADSLVFFFKSGSTVYKGTLPLRATSGTINLTKMFVLQRSGALVNGSTVPDIGDFVVQGFHYDPAGRTVYFPMTNKNRSIVLVYRGVTASTTGTLTSDRNLSFRITSGVYPYKFEIEGVGLSGGRLYFNTNRAKSSSDGNHDGVHVFKGYAV